jgi:hypothetical protein
MIGPRVWWYVSSAVWVLAFALPPEDRKAEECQ